MRWLCCLLLVVACRGSGEILVDADGDGWVEGIDCDDAEASVGPDKPEICNTVDDDCDGQVDEEPEDGTSYYLDLDRDGAAGDLSTVLACAPPDHAATEATDCDDLDADARPGADERCNGADDDCDGEVDEDAVDRPAFHPDDDGDGFGSAVEVLACATPAGHVLDGTDCDDADPLSHPGAIEICDARDNDCDAATDESAVDAPTWHDDSADGDGFGDPATSQRVCAAPEGWVGNALDCAPSDAERHPARAETCDDKDNDCDGTVDDGAADASVWYLDLDDDGAPGDRLTVFACDAPEGAGLAAAVTDCDDLDPAVHPGATEVCDGKDNDCGEAPDAGAVDALSFYADPDGDGFGDPLNPVRACEAPQDHVLVAGDCAPGDGGRFPGNPEVCDGKDNDCDGAVDDGVGDRWYADVDEDGAAGESVSVQACEAPEGYQAQATDCDDGDWQIRPGALERCDLRDNDCDLDVDEADGALGDALACPAESCLAIRDAHTDPVSDYYWLDPGGLEDPFVAWCEMEAAGGGWTLVGSFRNDDGTHHWTHFGDNVNIWPDHRSSWRDQTTFGSVFTFEAADHKSPAYWRVAGADLLAMDDGGRWAAYAGGLSGSLLETVTGHASCTTAPLAGVAVSSTDPILEERGLLTYYGGDPNNASRCALDYSVNVTDSSVITLGGGCCGTMGFGHVGFLTGSGLHTDRDFHFCLSDSPSPDTWYGFPSLSFGGGTCQHALLFVR